MSHIKNVNFPDKFWTSEMSNEKQKLETSDIIFGRRKQTQKIKLNPTFKASET